VIWCAASWPMPRARRRDPALDRRHAGRRAWRAARCRDRRHRLAARDRSGVRRTTPLAAARRCHRCARRLGPAVGTVLVIDELGFHQATSVGELLAARDVRSRSPRRPWSSEPISSPAGSRSLQRARSGETDSPVDRSCARSPRSGGVQLLHHPTGTIERRLVDWWCSQCHPRPRTACIASCAKRRSARCETCRRLHGAAPCPFGGHRGERAGSSI